MGSCRAKRLRLTCPRCSKTDTHVDSLEIMTVFGFPGLQGGCITFGTGGFIGLLSVQVGDVLG